MEDFKDELIFIINSKLKVGTRSTRTIISEFSFLNSMLLNRLMNYKSEDLKAEKLISLINQIDIQIHNKIQGFKMDLDLSSKRLKITYMGDLD